MERALIIGASGGIGSALAKSLQEKGAEVTGLSRAVDGLDVTDEQSVSHHLERLDGPYHRVIVATGALEIAGARPEKSITQWSAKAMLDQFSLNAVGPALALKHAKRLLALQERTVFAALSARVGSIGDNRLGGWVSYRSAKAALNQIIRTGSIELSRTHKQSICVCLHPGLWPRISRGSTPGVIPPSVRTRLQTGLFASWMA